MTTMMITYIRCPICGKLSKTENYHTKHEIPCIMTQEIKHPKGKKHFFLNIWKKKVLSTDEQKTLLLNLKELLERRLERICMMLEALNVRIHISHPTVRIYEQPIISIMGKPMNYAIYEKPTVSMRVKPEVKLWVKE